MREGKGLERNSEVTEPMGGSTLSPGWRGDEEACARRSERAEISVRAAPSKSASQMEGRER